MTILAYLAHSKSALMNPDHNIPLQYVLKKTFYAQFCAGENEVEVKRTMKGLKELGYKGVMLGYAKEIVMDQKEQDSLETSSKVAEMNNTQTKEIEFWEKGTLETARLAEEGDFVALKYVARQSISLLYANYL
jgi:proline dehydrogenase